MQPLGRRRSKAETTAAVLIGVRQGVAHEVHAAAPPGRAEHLGGGCFEAFVGVRDDELDPAQAAPRQLSQEVGPERLDLRGADIQARDRAGRRR